MQIGIMSLGRMGSNIEYALMRDPEYYRYELDLPEIAELWRRGTGGDGMRAEV